MRKTAIPSREQLRENVLYMRAERVLRYATIRIVLYTCKRASCNIGERNEQDVGSHRGHVVVLLGDRQTFIAFVCVAYRIIKTDESIIRSRSAVTASNGVRSSSSDRRWLETIDPDRRFGRSCCRRTEFSDSLLRISRPSKYSKDCPESFHSKTPVSFPTLDSFVSHRAPICFTGV